MQFIFNKNPNNSTNLVEFPQFKQKPVKNVILFTNARDEKNIKEWAAHHLLIGFNLIYIFDHKSVIPLKTVFNNFDKRVFVERCEMNDSPKMYLMNRALFIAKQLQADWFIYLDADEFLVLNNYYGVKQLLNKFYFTDSLAINWLFFGSNNHIKEPDGLIIDNYTKSDTELNMQVKTFVRPSQCINASNPHFYNMYNKNRMFSLDGNLISNEPQFNRTTVAFNKIPAFIAHYVYQSEETYVNRKINLPRDDILEMREKMDNIHDKHNNVDNLIVKNKYSEIVNTFLQQF